MFSKFNENDVLLAAVFKPDKEEVEQAVMEMIGKYVLFSQEKSGNFMKAIFISLMQPNDTFAHSVQLTKTLGAMI